jgi:hypothetical protein
LLAAAPHAEASFYRTSHGAEADLVLRFRGGETWVVEIKRSSAPTVSRDSIWPQRMRAPRRSCWSRRCRRPYPMRDGIEVMDPLQAAMLVDEEQQRQAATTPRH